MTWHSIRRRLKHLNRAFKPRSARSALLVPPNDKRQIQKYAEWIRRFDQLTPDDRQAILRHVEGETLPLILVLAVFVAKSQFCAEALLHDLREQLFTGWSAMLCFSPDCSEEAVSKARRLAEGDYRCRILRWAAHAGAEETLVTSKTPLRVLVVEPGIRLRQHALYAFSASAAQDPGAQLIYSDEDHLLADGQRHSPWFKPQFSPELALRTPYIGGCALIVETNLARLIDHCASAVDLAFYLSERALQLEPAQVVHIPDVLYHAASVACLPAARVNPIDLEKNRLPCVSIIIPTRDRRDLLEPCILSIEEKTLYPRSKLEIIILDNGSSEPSTQQYLADVARSQRVRVIKDGGVFNYSRINNFAAAHAKHEVYIFLNNDTLIHDRHWIHHLVHFAIQKDVGAVGAKLLYPDNTVQHGGIVIGVRGVAAHAHVGLREAEGGYRDLARLSHEVSAVTGACLAMRRSVFEEIGGFDEALTVAFSDVKLCLDALHRGYRNLYVAEPLMFHLESKSRGLDNTAAKIELFRREAAYTRACHRAIFKNDPYYSPNLSLKNTYRLAWPPRRCKPWQVARRRSGCLRVLMLSGTYEIGHGIAAIINLQAAYLSRSGFAVYIGGPAGQNEFSHESCRRVILDAPEEAACFAVENDIDCIVAHTPPFFSIVRWLGIWPKSVLCDYGEPNSEHLPNVQERCDVRSETRFCFELADEVYAISHGVQHDGCWARVGILQLGNSHLSRLHSDAVERRKWIRAELGVHNKIMVLNVCRFLAEGRKYEGIDEYIDVLRNLELQPRWQDKLSFVLCGKARKDDVRAMEAEGLHVFANVSDERLAELYSAADVYMNFSRWEEYNLGIRQALAFGLPVIASTVPAHSGFPIVTCDDVEEAVARFAELADGRPPGDWEAFRTPVKSGWDGPAKLAEIITNICTETHVV